MTTRKRIYLSLCTVCTVFSRNGSVHFRFHQILIVGKQKSASVSPATATRLPAQPVTSWQFRHHLTNQKWGSKCLGKLMDTLLLGFQMTRKWWEYHLCLSKNIAAEFPGTMKKVCIVLFVFSGQWRHLHLW